MSYQPGVPTGPIPLNRDYLNLQANFTQINTQWAVDHVPLTSTSGSPPNGYHKSIHMVPISTPTSNPPTNYPINGYSATTGYGQLLNATVNDGINIDQSLFFLTGGNRLMQLTRNFVPVPTPPNNATNGSTFLPGGMILQWGVVNGSVGADNHFVAGNTSSVSFSTANIAFPNNCFNVWTQSAYTSGNAPSSSNVGTFTIQNNFTKAGFTWFYSGTTSSYTKFYWYALGN